MPSQKGFSLVELLAALVVLTIIITTTLAVFSERRNRLNEASETILAYQALANEVEMQRRVPFNDVVPSATFLSAADLGLLKPLMPYDTKVDVNASKGGVKDVTLSITWHQGKRKAKVVVERVDTGGGTLW